MDSLDRGEAFLSRKARIGVSRDFLFSNHSAPNLSSPTTTTATPLKVPFLGRGTLGQQLGLGAGSKKRREFPAGFL